MPGRRKIRSEDRLRDCDLRELGDIGYEVETLRGEKLPGHLVMDVYVKLGAITDKMAENPIDDPEADARLLEDFARVLGRGNRKH